MAEKKEQNAKSKIDKFTNRLIIGVVSITIIILCIIIVKLAQIFI